MLRYTDAWLDDACISTLTDDVGAEVEVIRVPWNEHAFRPILHSVFSHSAAAFESRVGHPPTATKHTLKGVKPQHDALRAALASATQTLSQQYCMKDFNADRSYVSPDTRLGYLLKYTPFNAALSCVVVTRLARVLRVAPHAPHTQQPCLLEAHPPPQPPADVSVACYGGGPGTDALALLSALGHLGVGVAQLCVYDLPCWQAFWPDAHHPMPLSGECGSDAPTDAPAYLVPSVLPGGGCAAFEALDLLSEEAARCPLGAASAQSGFSPTLATFFYTANELANEAAHRAAFVRFVKSLAAGLQPGAAILILDRTRAAILSLLEEVSKECADLLSTEMLSERLEPVLPTELINKVCDYAARFGVKPRLAGKVGVTVFIVKERAPVESS